MTVWAVRAAYMVAAGLIVYGISLVCVPAAWCVAGVGVAAIGLLIDLDEPEEPDGTHSSREVRRTSV